MLYCCAELVQLPIHVSPDHRVHQVQAQVHRVVDDAPWHLRHHGPLAEADHHGGGHREQAEHSVGE